MTEQKSPVIFKLLLETTKNVINLYKTRKPTGHLNYTGPDCVYDILKTIPSKNYSINMELSNKIIISTKTNKKLFNRKYDGYVSDRWNMHYGEACQKNLHFGVVFPKSNTKKIISLFRK